MAEVQATLADINIVLNKFPVFAQEVRLQAASRIIDELEAKKCDCQKDELPQDEQGDD